MQNCQQEEVKEDDSECDRRIRLLGDPDGHGSAATMPRS